MEIPKPRLKLFGVLSLVLLGGCTQQSRQPDLPPRELASDSFPASPATRPAEPEAILRRLERAAAAEPMAAERELAEAAAAPAELEIHFIDVGQGDCTLIKCPNGDSILVDCGTSSGADSEAVRDYLMDQLDPEHPYLEAVFITHPDSDHYSLLDDVLADVEIGRIYAVGEPAEHSRGDVNEWLQTFLDRYEVLARADHDSAQPVTIGHFGDVRLYVLAANVDDGRPAWRNNTRSIVLKLTLEEFDVVLAGDATFHTEEDIVRRLASDLQFLDVEVLKVGHHGSETTSTSEPWAAALRPEVAVVSCARSNSYGHPRRAVLERLFPYTDPADVHELRWAYNGEGGRVVEDVEIEEAVYSTANGGHILITSDGEQFDVQYLRVPQ